MRTETMLIDLANMSMTRTISSRENDRNGFKVIVNLKERGKTVDLTGYVVKYEAISPQRNFVRDDVVVTSAKDGVFEYTVSKEAVSSAGVWIGYFAFEKGTERFTTQDIRISLGVDVKSGSIQLENYIAEFDKIKKQVDALQLAVDKADVVKKSGDTMTNVLNIDVPTAGGVTLKNKGINVAAISTREITGGEKELYIYFHHNNATPLIYSPSKGLIVDGLTNLLKKTGDTVTGQMNFDGAVTYRGNSAVFDMRPMVSGAYKKGFRHTVNNGGNFYTIAPMDETGAADWSKQCTLSGDTGEFTVPSLKTLKDTDWTNLTLLNGVTNQTGKTSKVKRTGNTVCLTVNVIGVKNNQIITTLPTAFRPLSDMGFSSSYIKNDLNSAEGIITIRADGSVHCEWISEGSTPLKFWSFTLTYLI